MRLDKVKQALKVAPPNHTDNEPGGFMSDKLFAHVVDYARQVKIGAGGNVILTVPTDVVQQLFQSLWDEGMRPSPQSNPANERDL